MRLLNRTGLGFSACVALLAVSAWGCSSDATDDAAGTGGAPTGGTDGSGAQPGTGGGPSGGGGTGGDAGPFFGASRCEAAGLLLCDGFEATALDEALWTVAVAGGNTVELVTTQAARGAQSVHIHTVGSFGYLSTSSIFPAAQGGYYGRMFLRVARYSTVDWAHWTVAEAAGTGDTSKIRVGGQYVTDQAKNRWGVGSDGGPTGDWTTHDTDPDGAPVEPPLDTWTCLEWHHSGVDDTSAFYVDGVEHPSLATTKTSHGGAAVDYVMPEFTSVWFGWWQYQTDPLGFDVWIDEVALDDERIGCER